VSPKNNPEGPDQKTYKVVRGGSANSDAANLRLSDRYWARPESIELNFLTDIGFRCAMSYQPDDLSTEMIQPTPSVDENVKPTLEKDSSRVRDVDGMAMSYIPAGEFIMGTKYGSEADALAAMPQHAVYLDGFWMDQFEVTNAQYRECIDAGDCSVPLSYLSNTRSDYFYDSQFDNFAVTNVSFQQAQGYCSWAGGRLPTEAEWEKGARGTDGRWFPWGDSGNSCLLGNVGRCFEDIVEVGNYPDGVSPYGLYDMAGNVAEWVSGWFDEDYYENSPYENPTGPDTGITRIIRGGSWDDVGVEVFLRKEIERYGWGNDIGFRCVMDADE
jgi:formylglycine-generating enzyme required for sulfatase activity